MDLLTQAVQNLMGTAQSTATSNNATYRAGIYTFNIDFNTVTPLTSSLSAAQSQAANIQLYEVPYQNWSNDAITNYTNAMTQINTIMPNPGGGTRTAGDTPQEVLFIVTDGVEDQMVNGSRVQSLMSKSYCTTIKNRGIRIAVLYPTAAADQLLVQHLHQAVPDADRPDAAELRVTRPLFPGVDRPGHLERAGAAVQYRGGNGASDAIAGDWCAGLSEDVPGDRPTRHVSKGRIRAAVLFRRLLEIGCCDLTKRAEVGARFGFLAERRRRAISYGSDARELPGVTSNAKWKAGKSSPG